MRSRLTASVVVAAGHRPIVAHALEALAKQRGVEDHMEIVYVDAGSSDETRERIGALRFPCPLRTVTPAMEGRYDRSRARNEGLLRATGDVVVFIDADVLAGPEFVASHLQVYARASQPMLVPGYLHGYPMLASARTPEAMCAPAPDRIVDVAKHLFSQDAARWGDCRETYFDFEPSALAADPRAWTLCWTSNLSCTRRLAERVGGFDEAMPSPWGHEDAEFAFRMTQAGARVELSRAAWAVHYPHPVTELGEGIENLRYIVKKHPTLDMEAFGWRAQAGPEMTLDGFLAVHSEIRALQERAPREPVATDDPDLPELARALGPLADAGPLAWLGPLPNGGALGNLLPAFHADPLGRGTRRRLSGLCLPLRDASMSTIVVWAYWQDLPTALPHVLAEATRVGARVVLVGDRAEADAPLISLPGAAFEVIRSGRWTVFSSHD